LTRGLTLLEIIKKKGPPRPFIPEPSNMAFYRNIAEQASLRFMQSPFVQRTRAKLPRHEMHKFDIEIPTRDGSCIKVRVYHPYRILNETLPVVVNAHGGGWCLGGLYTDQFPCEIICRGLDLVVVDVDYRLAPEHTFPVPFDDLYDAVRWVSFFT
jgi:acetyl esterase/lipase